MKLGMEHVKKVITMLLFLLVAVTCASAQGGVNSENQCAPNSEEWKANVHLEVPEFIEMGLSDGSMERVGGVIRYADNQQSIAWLRQVGQIGEAAQSSADLMEDITRLAGSRSLALGQLLTSVTPILNISMAGFSLLEHIADIRAREAELERVYDRVAEEFQRDREVELLAALDYAENILFAQNEAYKHYAVARVTYELGVARAQLLKDLEELLPAEGNEETIELAMNYQVLAMNVCSMSARLHLEIGEDEAAIDLLSKCVSEQENYTRSFVKKWLDDNPALFFHESISDEYFERYLEIERWLRGKRDVLPEIVRENRHSFWDGEAIGALYWGRNLREDPFYLTSLPQAEILLENYQRLEGFELELKSMCLPTFAEWEAYDGDNGPSILEHDGYVMLVDSSQLASG